MGFHFSASPRPLAPRSPSFSLAPLASGHARWTRIVAFGLAAMLFGAGLVSSVTAADARHELTAQDIDLLDDIQRRSGRFFLEHSDPVSGLTRDRAPKDGSSAAAPASIAATGFALTAWCIADARGWIPAGEAVNRVRTTLRFIAERAEHERGWFYHFIDLHDGRRVWECEASTIDTALLMKGALTAREYLRDPETSALVEQLYRRIDWQWALNGGDTLSHGWHPETGFIPHRWDNYSELMGMYLLGIGATHQRLDPKTWHAWDRGPVAEYEGRTFLQGGPLFTHQFAQAWVDFRGKRDDYADYWQNSVDATLAQRAWAAGQSERYPHWSHEMWGLTASDSATGYRAWGTPGHANETADGTLVPCAPGGSLPFAPRECLTALARMRDTGGPDVWGRYGFADAFNPQTGWTSPDVIGIDVGITLLMAENLRTGLVWDAFMRAPEIQRAMSLVGFRPVASSTDRPLVLAN